MVKNNKKGFVIEMMIIFMFVTFGFCMVVTAYMGSLSIERKYAKKTIDMQTDLNQVGEYYLRYIEESGEQFPKGNETSFASSEFKWMDDEAKEFFIRFNNSYGYTFEPSFSITRGGFREFYETKYIWRKLVVKNSAGDIKMIIELKEERISNNDTSYDIQNWSIGEALVDETVEDGGYKEDDLPTLQKLWRFLGVVFNSISDLLKSGDWLTFFRGLIGNFDDLVRSLA